MSNTITFYTNPFSRGRIVHWMLEELGVPYQTELLSFERAEHKRPEFLAINPMGKLPAIRHGSTVVTEVAAICTYLADAFPAARLAPALDDPARGSYLRWLFFGAGCIEPAIVDHMFKRPPPDRPGVLGYGSYDDVLNTLEAALKPGPWLLGAEFTTADLYVGAQLGWGMMTKGIEPRPAFQAYVARQAERPAFKRFTEKSKEFEATLAARG